MGTGTSSERDVDLRNLYAVPLPTEEQVQEAAERREAQESAAIDRVLGYTPFIKNGGGDRREVALTFDDGPSQYTPEILETLRRTDTPATFFTIGSEIPDRPELIEEELGQGHTIGNHTQDHPPMGDLSPGDQKLQLKGQAAAMASTGAPEQRLFRPPYRSFSAATLELLRKQKLLMVLWSVDTQDYEGLGAEEITQRVLDEVQPGSIILMHDGGGDRSQTAAALPGIIEGLRRLDLRPVTVPRMILDDPPPDGQGLPEGLSGS